MPSIHQFHNRTQSQSNRFTFSNRSVKGAFHIAQRFSPKFLTLFRVDLTIWVIRRRPGNVIETMDIFGSIGHSALASVILRASARGYFLLSMKRVWQALETRILVDKIFDGDPEAKIVVCDDFIAPPGEVPVEAICGRVENTNNPDLRSRVLIPCSKAIPESVRFSLYRHGDGNLLDHMLMSQSILTHFRHAEIHTENLHDASLPFSSDTKDPESDHAAFVSEFSAPT